MSTIRADRRPIAECPVCGAADRGRERWMTSLGFDLVRCVACGHRYATEIFSEADLAGGYYDEPDADIAGRSLTAKRERFFNEYEPQIAKLFPRPGRVLDVGCNAGELLGLLKEIGWTVAGVEASPGPASFARARVDAPVWQGDAEVAIPEEERFDLITMTHVLEHMPHPGRLLDRLRRALRPGGALLIEVPNADDALIGLWGGYYRPLCPGDHVSFFDERSLRRLLDEHGFAVASVDSPTHARDVVYGSALSAADLLRAPRSTAQKSGGVMAQTRYRGRLRAPIRRIVDRFVEVIDPLVVMAARSRAERRQGPVLIITALLSK